MLYHVYIASNLWWQTFGMLLCKGFACLQRLFRTERLFRWVKHVTVVYDSYDCWSVDHDSLSSSQRSSPLALKSCCLIGPALQRSFPFLFFFILSFSLRILNKKTCWTRKIKQITNLRSYFLLSLSLYFFPFFSTLPLQHCLCVVTFPCKNRAFKCHDQRISWLYILLM